MRYRGLNNKNEIKAVIGDLKMTYRDLSKILISSERDTTGKGIARAQRNDESLALLYMDLDKFKPINDIYGHEVGDAVLKEGRGWHQVL